MKAVFETMRVRGSVAPLHGLHRARLESSLIALQLPVPKGLSQAMVPGNGMREGVLRVDVGPTGLSATTRDLPSSRPFAVGSVLGYRPYPYKTVDRGQFDAARIEARARGADDALLVTAEGFVAEGTVWTVFWWEGDVLCTPPLALGILPGVARARILGLRAGAELRATLEHLSGKSLFAANAVRGVVPVSKIDGREVPADPRTALLAKEFWPTAEEIAHLNHASRT